MRQQVFHAARLVKDIFIQIVLPTAVLVVVQKEIFPWKLLYRIVPDVVIVAVIAIALLYIGGLLKLLRSVAMVVRYKLDPGRISRILNSTGWGRGSSR